MPEIANTSLEIVIVLLRAAVVLLLYFFLFLAVRAVLRDIRSGPAQASAAASPFGNLVVVRAGQSGIAVGKIFPLGVSTIIGRSMDQCEIALNDSFLSQQHARLDVRGEDWVLEDLGSTNGTFLNDVEVRDAAVVEDGDILRFGRVELRLITAR